MNNLLKQLLLGGSATALLAGGALAQNAGELDVETVQSSVSRIDLKGFEAPTPVTVIGIEQINRDAKVQLGDQIRELPQIRGGTAITSGSGTNNLVNVNAGADTVSIRGMGAQRNLVLFDRQRVVISNIQDGTVDLALIPSGLTQRVDVVTGGASAVWGSDAVTGVINIVLNKTFQGFKGSFTYSNNTEIENSAYRASLAWGTSFLGGKGHIVAAADWNISNQTLFPGDLMRRGVTRNDGRGLVYNPAYCSSANIRPTGAPGSTSTCSSPNAGQPLLTYAYGVGSTTAVQGGLVTGNTGGTAGSGLASGGLKGTMFVGSDADPQQFYYGTVSNTNTCYNGCTNDQYGTGGWTPAKQPYHSGTYFAYASYQLLPDVKMSIQLNYARLSTRANGGVIGSTGRVIYADNPYLPDPIAQRFVCNPALTACGAGTTVLSNGYNPYTRQNEIGALTVAQRQARPSQTMTMGFEFSGNRQNPSPSSTVGVNAVQYSQDEFCEAIMQNCGFYGKAFMRGVFTLDGTIGDSWTWTTYIQHSTSRIKENLTQPIQQRLNNALDAVRITSGNVGTSGLPIGSIQCRGLLNPSTAAPVPAAAANFGITAAGELAGCVPFNPFGLGEVSNAASNYIKPGLNPSKTGSQGTVVVNLAQAAGAFSMAGVLPWALPAGEVGVAFGGEWRLERHGQSKIDKYSQAGGMYPSGNFGVPFEGKQHVEEGFLEVAIPVLKDMFVQTLNLDLAGRLTNYSNSGLVETWKIGLQSQIIDDVRFRMTWSHDIRAPTIYDLSVPGSLGNQFCQSFIVGPTGSNGGAPNQCFQFFSGNPTLGPERANTIAAGFVLTPTFVPGLTASVDWYQIHLSGAIVTPGLGDIINRCRAGELVYCPLITFAGGLPYPQGTASQIEFVLQRPVNAGALNAAGFDVNIAYGFDLFTGSADVSVNGNYAYDDTRILNGVEFNRIGCTGCNYGGGSARFQGNVNFNYREGPWSLGLQVRLTGDSVQDRGNPTNQPGINIRRVTYNSAGVATVSAGQVVDGMTPTLYNPWQATTDVRAQYRWSNNITLFANVDNIQNLPYGGTFRRAYRMGVRFNY
jgi:outer membrane receptor protein involved in Fe transport